MPFRAHPLLPGGHLQTLAGYYLPAQIKIGQPTLHHIALQDGDQLVLCETRATRKAPVKKAIVLMHGLGGDANSPYMLRLGHIFLTHGWHVFRMNHRGCGQGEGLARLSYHSGKSDDISAVLSYIEKQNPGLPVVAAGFSLSGNALLKLLGEHKYRVPTTLKGGIAVCPPIDLARSSAALSQIDNRIYELRFLLLLRRIVKQQRLLFSDFPDVTFDWRMTLKDFDDRCTAPLHHFDSAVDYYKKCSAKQFLHRIAHRTMLLASLDDPFIPPDSYDALPENEHLTYVITKSGGHMGYVAAEPTPLHTSRWMDYAILYHAGAFLANREQRA